MSLSLMVSKFVCDITPVFTFTGFKLISTRSDGGLQSLMIHGIKSEHHKLILFGFVNSR